MNIQGMWCFSLYLTRKKGNYKNVFFGRSFSKFGRRSIQTHFQCVGWYLPVVFLEAASGLLANSDPKMAACREIRKGSKWPYGGR